MSITKRLFVLNDRQYQLPTCLIYIRLNYCDENQSRTNPTVDYTRRNRSNLYMFEFHSIDSPMRQSTIYVNHRRIKQNWQSIFMDSMIIDNIAILIGHGCEWQGCETDDFLCIFQSRVTKQHFREMPTLGNGNGLSYLNP